MDVLEKLAEKDRHTSKHGACFYKFDKEKYGRRLEEGFNFSFI
jgi:hypothetical protein